MKNYNYQRGRLLGHGSSGTVYLGTDLNSGELFAVKSFRTSNSQCAVKEQSILSSLSSPFIISYLGSDVSRNSNQLCHNLFMEYASNGSLADKINRYGKLDEISIRYHTYQILSGLSYLHSQNIIHCDIKGQNILIDSNNKTKISDFGCAKYEFNEHLNTQLAGTPMYFAPEVARGEEQGKPADLWALGCTVIEMATGGVPWPGFFEHVSVLNHIGYSNDVPMFPDWISEQGKDFLSKCLSRDVKERWSVEKLLKHPFVATMEGFEFEKEEMGIDESPKSILDQAFWESLSYERTEVLERICDLVTGEECDCPDWTGDEHNWVNVRDNGNYEMFSRVISVGENGDYEMITSVSNSEGEFGSTGDDFASTGDDHESELYQFDLVYNNNNNNDDDDFLKGGCWENEINLYCFANYYCNEYKSKKGNGFSLSFLLA